MDNQKNKKTRSELYKNDNDFEQDLDDQSIDITDPEANLERRKQIASQKEVSPKQQVISAPRRAKIKELPPVVTTPPVATRQSRTNKSSKIKLKKSHRLRNFFLWLFGILAAITLVGGYIYLNVKSAIENAYGGLQMTSARNTTEVLESGKPFSILLLGADTGSLGRNDTGRTDTIMVATINPKNKTTTLVSLPRDSMVSVVGYEETFPQKLNDAYAFGSTETTIRTVQDWLNIPIDFYVLVNMGALEKIVDEVGGIKVNSPLTFTYQPDDYKPYLYKFYKGKSYYDYAPDGKNFKRFTTMDGNATLAFTRMRFDDPEGDYGRTKRQRLVIETLLSKTSNIGSLLSRSFLRSISDNVKTNLTFDNFLTIASSYRGAVKNIENDSLRGNGYIFPDIEGNQIIYELIEDDEKQRITDKIRKSLKLPAKDTGNRFGGSEVTGVDIPNPNPFIGDNNMNGIDDAKEGDDYVPYSPPENETTDSDSESEESVSSSEADDTSEKETD